MTVAVYPGSFDPITNGHIDIITRAARIFDRLVVGVYAEPNKPVLFSLEERVEFARLSVAHLHNVEVEPFHGLTAEFARKMGIRVIVRGLRATGDFEKEFDMAMMHRQLDDKLEIFCMVASPEYQFLRSSLLKEIARLGGDVSAFVPAHVAAALKQKNSKDRI
jgi:pantetheine-phosphate adenylyltransferase